ncbi:ATP-dependent DNA helicase [Anaeromicropila herbilytica]|uniref:ATP-dependent helicase n=1 Tax=Anaeromicropila herbilytica TaxID=2785025 RepID=A0A7R7EJ58_9FIRM|nr:ATP-dependent DNA helicase [Anaeromicropila herbilytica]BCN29730.1 ATP-dependent helicase [Anaeromicropila herbilytica]
MFQIKDNVIKISVRNLVEFILKSGDLDNRRVTGRDTEAMREGSKLHRKIQKRMGSEYHPEVPLSIIIPLDFKEEEVDLLIEGRADGIIYNENKIELQDSEEDMIVLTQVGPIKSSSEKEMEGQDQIQISNKDIEVIKSNEDIDNIDDNIVDHFMFDEFEKLSSNEDEEKPNVIIDEIKGVYFDVNFLEEPIKVHKAQVMCYAYMYAVKHKLDKIGIRLTYSNIETENMKYFNETLEFVELEQWFVEVINEYKKWAAWQYQWRLQRDASIEKLEFPFEYRPGQKDLVTGVYKTIIRDKKLFIEAPTGVGKTISTIFPTLKAMGAEKTSKIFYLTAKTITRTVAEDTYRLLVAKGLRIKVVTITAKDKICVLDKPDCNPVTCERAKGHFDRVNDAVFDLLWNEHDISRELIEQYALKHMVCPFEMSLDITNWADSVICDYNYVFDPNVYLRRFFQDEKKNDYVFLIDEAHNLVERAREMYSASLFKDDILAVKKIMKPLSKNLEKRFEACNQDLLKLKRECENYKVIDNIGDFVIHLMRLLTDYEEYTKEHSNFEGSDKALEIYFDIRHFINMYEWMDDKYIIYNDYDEERGFRIKLLCMDPSNNLLTFLEKGRSTVFFSATLLPIHYYKEQLGGKEEDYAIYAPSPFDTNKRLLMIGNDVSTKYTRRNENEYVKIVNYIENLVMQRTGNYLVFFPSYSYMQQIYSLFTERDIDKSYEVILQKTNMTEMQREEFLEQFEENGTITKIGFCVLGGVFSEGIDLTNDRLIGVIIVGTGLPMVCNERELFREYYDRTKNAGFDYAYLYVGMNKVLQSAGRVIRTSDDTGVILLLDERFMNTQYKNLFPREWYPHEVVNVDKMKFGVQDFWNRT